MHLHMTEELVARQRRLVLVQVPPIPRLFDKLPESETRLKLAYIHQMVVVMSAMAVIGVRNQLH